MHTCFIEYELNFNPALKLGQGVCVPAVCADADVAQLAYVLMNCQSVVDAYIATCVEPVAKLACLVAANYTACLRKFEATISGLDSIFETTGNVTGVIPHCGTVEYTQLDAGAAIMAIVIALLFVLAFGAYVIERSRRLAKEKHDQTAASAARNIVRGGEKKIPSNSTSSPFRVEP
jgi:hypothetical protein